MLSALALTACSDDKFTGDPAKEITGFFDGKEEAGFSTYYTPTIGRVGDPMPFYDEKSGTFKILYLQEYETNRPYRFHPIWAVETADGANYKDLGELIPTGGTDKEQDAAPGTGCCYYSEDEDLYYVYYTGHNGQLANVEAVLRATSKDLKTWTKDNLFALYGKDYGYSTEDFRDPQIFKEGGKYHMIIATRPLTGGDPCFVDFTSTDLKNWGNPEKIRMIWDRFLECPDVFQMGNKWYCVYSESFPTDWSRKVKYMMADSWEELKSCFNDGPKWPADDREGVLETRAFYAGKTASDGDDRYIWGWSPYRSGSDIHEKNLNVGAAGEPNWSGSLVCHKLIQHENGTLSVGEVPAMAAKYCNPAKVTVVENKNFDGSKIAGDGYVIYNRLGVHNHISFTVKTAGDGDRFGVSFARDPESDRWYTMVMNPEWENGRRKVNFEQQGTGDNIKWFVAGADGYIFPRPSDNTYNIDIYTDNSVVVMYVNGDYGTTQRIYGLAQNCWSIDSFGGNIEISDVMVSQY